MINNEMRNVSVLTYTTTVDECGQKRQGTPTSRDTQMCVKIYSQSNVKDIRFTDVDLIGITKDTGITDANVILIDNVKYNVLFTIPSSRYYQILMKKA